MLIILRKTIATDSNVSKYYVAANYLIILTILTKLQLQCKTDSKISKSWVAEGCKLFEC